MFTIDNIPKGLGFLKNTKNSIVQKDRCLSVKLFHSRTSHDSPHSKGKMLYANICEDYIYLKEIVYETSGGKVYCSTKWTYKFCIRRGALRVTSLVSQPNTPRKHFRYIHHS